jgi:hypothetical protein
MRQADTAKSYADNLNRIPGLQALMSNLGKVATETDFTKAQGYVPNLTPEEKKRLDDVSSIWQWTNAKPLAELQKIAKEREAQKNLELLNLLGVQEQQTKARDKYVIQDPSGRYMPLYTMPTGPTAAPASALPGPAPRTIRGLYRQPDGSIGMWDGQTFVPYK